jgi:hypothetical protein
LLINAGACPLTVSKLGAVMTSTMPSRINFNSQPEPDFRGAGFGFSCELAASGESSLSRATLTIGRPQYGNVSRLRATNEGVLSSHDAFHGSIVAAVPSFIVQSIHRKPVSTGKVQQSSPIASIR